MTDDGLLMLMVMPIARYIVTIVTDVCHAVMQGYASNF